MGRQMVTSATHDSRYELSSTTCVVSLTGAGAGRSRSGGRTAWSTQQFCVTATAPSSAGGGQHTRAQHVRGSSSESESASLSLPAAVVGSSNGTT